MSLSFYASQAGKAIITGLSTDTKPGGADGVIFIEEDTGKHFRKEAGAFVAKIPAAAGGEKVLSGVLLKDTANTFYTYVGEILVEKATTHTYFINAEVSAGVGSLKLYNFTNNTDILTVSVLNTGKELKTGTIPATDLITGNNTIELWVKNTAGTITIYLYQIKVS